MDLPRESLERPLMEALQRDAHIASFHAFFTSDTELPLLPLGTSDL